MLAPLPTCTSPLLPALDDPVLNRSEPLTPDSPAFALRIITLPLDDAVPSPDDTHMTPPVCTVLRPAPTSTWPPAPLVPDPTVTNT
ncbi:MAG: hypothetical protein VX000_00335, partial [Myxococcota bacterium]|nr:hypothetical protein [Myxococcota bacterium]